MPDRILRDELLSSDRWLRLGGKDMDAGNARRLAFVACVLTADSLGNMEATSTRLERLWRDFGLTDDAAIEETLVDFKRSDLARVYLDEDGKRFLHLPRYGQRLRYLGRLCPLSPWTTEEQKQEITKKSPGANPVSTGRAPSAHQAPAMRESGEHPASTRRAPVEVKRSEVEVEVKRREVEVKRTEGGDYARATHVGAVIGDLSSKEKTGGPEGPLKPTPKPNGKPGTDWWLTSQGIEAKGKDLGLAPQYRETSRAFKDRIFKALHQRKPRVVP